MGTIQISPKGSGRVFELNTEAEIPQFPSGGDDTKPKEERTFTAHATFKGAMAAFVESMRKQDFKIIPIIKGEYKNIREIRKNVTKVQGIGAFTSRYLWIFTGKKWEKFCKKSEITEKNKASWKETEQC